MRFLISLFSCLVFINTGYCVNDTTKIIFFQDSNIQQFRGVEWHRISKKIKQGNYHKAILKIDLGCASYGCCAWDYTYRGFFSKRMDSGFRDIEVARLITPYSSYMRKNTNGFDSLWTHPYIYDVTDYLPLLYDSPGRTIYYSALTGGWDDKGKFGFKHTVTLYLISGDTKRNPQRVIPAFQNDYKYLDSIQFDNQTKPVKFKLKGNEKHVKLRTIFTGHDPDGEFSPIYFYVSLNGKEIYSKRLWKTDCDRNPIQPQSGTWIFPRTNWCPGEKVEEIEVALQPLLTKDSNEIDIYLGTIQSQSKDIKARYSIESHLITYNYKDSFDLAVEDIVSPSNNPNYKLFNPSCLGMKIKVKNQGIVSQTSLILNVNNKKYLSTFSALKTYESRIVELNNVKEIPLNKYSILLETNLKNQNKLNDEAFASNLIVPSFLTNKLIFEIQTTNDSSINKLTLLNSESKIILEKNYQNLNLTYLDTINLPTGCYQLTLTDYDKNYECGDGLSFWYSNRIGKKTSGIFRIRDGYTNKIIKVFNPDFGGMLNYQFIIK